MSKLEIGLAWGTLQKASLLELIEIAGRHGFTTLGLRPDVVLETVEAVGETGLRKRLADARTRVRVIDAMTRGLAGQPAVDSPDPRLVGMPVGTPESCLRAAAAVEAPIINICYYAGPPTPRNALADAIGAYCAAVARHGLELVVEPAVGTVAPTFGSVVELFEAAGSPANGGLLLDYWHLARTDGTVADIEALPKGFIRALQICDRIPPEPGAPYVPLTGRSLPGEGVLPTADFTRAVLANRSPDQPAVTGELEVFSVELRELPLDAAAARIAEAVRAWGATID